MKTIMSRILNEKDLNTVDQVQQFLIGTQLIAFQIKDRYRPDFSFYTLNFGVLFLPPFLSGVTPQNPRGIYARVTGGVLYRLYQKMFTVMPGH